MPAISGFHAVTYDPSIDLTQVVTPPYDVVDAGQRAKLASRHPHNFVRIDLPEAGPDGDRYRSAAQILVDWRTHNILHRDPSPVLYRYDQVFTDPEHGRVVTRRGVLAAVALSPWSERVVRPHEATMAGPREDRARLLAATRVHLSPVFAAYDDPDRGCEPLFAACSPDPERIARTDDGTIHKLWRIANPEAIARWSALLRDKWLYMLDGHHRYETMVAFQGHRLEGARRPYSQYGLMFLVSIAEPGLIILPTHRIVQGVADLDRDRFLAEVSRDCEIEVRAGAARDAAQLRGALDEASGRPAFAAVFARCPDAYLLSVRDGRARSPLEPDASILHDVILKQALADHAGAATTRVRYVSNTAATLDQIGRGEGQLALIMRPPALAQLKQVADAGRVMPQKSTYFFPKLASGLVMMPVE
jgi:uncharacterized protein (DUF1015 family)